MMSGDGLIEWADKQPSWARDALRRHAAATGFQLGSVDKEAIEKRVRNEAGITDEKLDSSPIGAAHLKLDSAKAKRNLLTALGPVENLGQVAPDQRITFAIDGITLVYGDNGSGKSSYCRIAKKICRSLSSEDLLGNVFAEGEKPKASATVSFTPDPQTPVTTVVWTDGEEGLEATRHLSVFDSRNAHLYVGKQNKIGFLPPVISILERHGAHRSEMDGVFSSERKALEEGFKVALPAGYTVGGKIVGLIEGLSVKATSLPNRSDLEKLGSWGSGDAAELAELEKSVGQDPAALAARATRSADNIEALATNFELAEERLSDAKMQAIAGLAADATAKAVASALAASELFANEPLATTGSEPWKLMFEHAEAFAVSTGLAEMPTALGEPCSLCQEPLTVVAADRMSRFKLFVEGAAAIAAEEAKAALATELAILNELTFPTDAALTTSLIEFSQSAPVHAELAGSIVERNTALRGRHETLVEATAVGDFSDVPLLGDSLALTMRDTAKKLRDKASQLTLAATSDEAKAERVARLSELKDRERLSQNLAVVLARWDQLALHAKLRKCSALVGTQAVSTAVTALRRKLFTPDFQKRVQSEIDALDLGHIPFAVADQSREGTSYFEVNLSSAVPVDNASVLSEGEQRALALACFLAEASTDAANHGLIVDDPVSSLDHLRIRRVARRLAAEAAKGKQIIIFTHNLLFYNEMADAAAAHNPAVPVARRLISKTAADGFGVVANDEEPWAGKKTTLRIGALRERQKQISTDHADFSTDTYRATAKDFYTDMRETWERFVEEVLLGKTVERFNSEVKTQSLKSVVVEDSDYKTIYWAMKRVSERSGHDMAAGKNIPVPTPDDMKADLGELETFREQVAKRGKDQAKVREALEQAPKAQVFD